MAKNKNLKLDLTLDEAKLLHDVCARDDYVANVEQTDSGKLDAPLTASIAEKLGRLLDDKQDKQPEKQALLHFDTEHWDEDVLKSKLPVLVDFTASWCGPCKILAPHIAAIAEERVGMMKIGKLDIDANEAITDKYNVRGVPTLLVFVDGEVVGQSVGSCPKKSIDELLDRAIKGQRPGLPTKKKGK